jgi:cytochrome c oxidase subunit 3
MDMSLKQQKKSIIHPHKFGLWLAMGSITMMFGAFTSAYIVRQAAGNWLEFRLPDVFYISTVVILLSSVSLHTSYTHFKAEKENTYKIFLVISLVLGVSFVALQYLGWTALFNEGVDLKGNPSGSFLYLITGVHAAHVLGGIAALFVAILHAFTLKFKVTEKRRVRFQLVNQYWHFVDLLWVYLFIFLLLTR